MIRRVSKENDLKDYIKSCPSGVIDDIYKIEYFIQGYNTVIDCSYVKDGSTLIVTIPSENLKTLQNGILMRRAYYKDVDSSYPDGYYNLQFVDNMSIWLGDEDSSSNTKLISLSVSQNGTYTPPTGYYGFSSVAVNVSEGKPEERLVETITVNGSYEYTPTPGSVFSGADITVAVSQKTEVSLVDTITSNSTYEYTPEPGSVFNSVSIAVSVPSTITVTLTQAEYDELVEKDQNTIYLING